MISVVSFYVLTIALGITKAIVDTLSFRRKYFSQSNTLPDSWQIENSWRNKWKNGDPAQGEKFWGSSRWLVPLTDAFHLFGMLNHILIFAAILTYSHIDTTSHWYLPPIYLSTSYILSRTSFHIFYTHLLVK